MEHLLNISHVLVTRLDIYQLILIRTLWDILSPFYKETEIKRKQEIAQDQTSVCDIEERNGG